MTLDEKIAKVKKDGFDVEVVETWVQGRNRTCDSSFRYHNRIVGEDGFVMFTPDKSIRGKSVAIFVNEATTAPAEHSVIV
jgi:hypothetical protein